MAKIMSAMAVLAILFAVSIAVSITLFVSAAYAQTTEGNSFVNSSWNAIMAITGIVTVASGIALFWVSKLRSALINSKSEQAKKLLNVLDNYIIPALTQGQKVAEITAKQEVKAKQFGEILYGFMGDKANEIRDKYEVKLVNLTEDVNNATKGTIEYNNKLKEMEQLIEEIKGEIAQSS